MIVTEILSQSGEGPEPGPSAYALHEYVKRRWPNNRGLIYGHQRHELVVRLPDGVVETVMVTPEDVERGWPTD